jgi:hypothetical protein
MIKVCAFRVLAAVLAGENDSSGIYGGIMHYALVFALVGSALLAFIYFWSKGRLDMDEEPKMQMMRNDNKEDGHGS